MEQVYADAAPKIVQFGENIGASIGLAAMFYLLPILVTYKWGRQYMAPVICYGIFIIFPITAGFFSDYWNFVNRCAAKYDVEGTNYTLAYSTVNNTCIKPFGQTVINSTCFEQNILTSLVYKDQVYVYGNYTNTYSIRPAEPSAQTSQRFMPWAPTIRNYDEESTDAGRTGEGLLISIISCYLFLLLWSLAMATRKCEQEKLEGYRREVVKPKEQMPKGDYKVTISDIFANKNATSIV